MSTFSTKETRWCGTGQQCGSDLCQANHCVRHPSLPPTVSAPQDAPLNSAQEHVDNVKADEKTKLEILLYLATVDWNVDDFMEVIRGIHPPPSPFGSGNPIHGWNEILRVRKVAETLLGQSLEDEFDEPG